MKFTILLKNEDDSFAPLIASQIERTGPLNAATLGLTLDESKCLLANIQKKLVESQLQSFVRKQRICTRCGTRRTLKDYHTVCFKTLLLLEEEVFGDNGLRATRAEEFRDGG